MEVTAGSTDRWRWAYGSTPVDGIDTSLGIVGLFPVFGLVEAHGPFYFDRYMTRRLVDACASEAEKAQSTEDLSSALHEEIQPPFPADIYGDPDEDEYPSGEGSLVLITDEQVTFCHLGGAGIFHQSRNGLTQVAQPHTLIHQLVREGRMERAMGAKHPNLGMRTSWFDYHNLESPPAWERGRIILAPGDKIVIVTVRLSWQLEMTGGLALGELPGSAEACAHAVLALDQHDPERLGSRTIVLERAHG